MEQYKIFSAGKFIETGNKLDVVNKYTGQVFASTFSADAKVLNDTIEAAQQAIRPCAALAAFEKYAALMHISNQLTNDKQKLGELLCTESGKSIKLAVAEIERAAQTFLVAAEESKRLPREYLGMDWTKTGKGKEGVVRYFPAGIVAGISPFNFPMNLAVHKIAPAIAAGCPIILKPASATPLSTLALSRIISETGLPKGAVSVLPMDRKTGNLLVTDDRIKVLSFTGSPVVGWELKKQSGKKKVVLELGGNAGVIVSSSAVISDIMPKCVAGAFAYSGQICIHAQRFYVHESHHDDFLKQITAKAGQLKKGDPLQEQTDISVMIDEENALRVEQWVNEALDQGAKLVCGGKREGRYYAPTILTNTSTAMKVNSEEIFGPVICVEKFSAFGDAVTAINDTGYGLQCGVFTDSVSELDEAFWNLEVGGVIHNDVPTLRFDHMPYGGVKNSGQGREGVRYAILDMMEARILVK
jgi:acyl-CoA reductase-like NAD-dependent aldehyde dehydrogenase